MCHWGPERDSPSVQSHSHSEPIWGADLQRKGRVRAGSLPLKRVWAGRQWVCSLGNRLPSNRLGSLRASKVRRGFSVQSSQILEALQPPGPPQLPLVWPQSRSPGFPTRPLFHTCGHLLGFALCPINPRRSTARSLAAGTALGPGSFLGSPRPGSAETWQSCGVQGGPRLCRTGTHRWFHWAASRASSSACPQV